VDGTGRARVLVDAGSGAASSTGSDGPQLDRIVALVGDVRTRAAAGLVSRRLRLAAV
jgi:hypothetical protein